MSFLVRTDSPLSWEEEGEQYLDVDGRDCMNEEASP